MAWIEREMLVFFEVTHEDHKHEENYKFFNQAPTKFQQMIIEASSMYRLEVFFQTECRS